MSSYAQFGLDQAAFAPQTGPESYYESESHRRALANLRHGLKQAEGIVILTGDEGVGKTEIFNMIAAEYAGQSPQVILLDGASLAVDEIEPAILAALGGDDQEDDSLVDVLVARREEGQAYALFFDNADQFTDEALEKIRQLSVMFHDGEALLQISLAGNTPMRSILYKESMDRFRQRVIASYHISSLSPDEVRDYLRARVSAAGGELEKLFSAAALDALAKHSGGVPAKINLLADRAIELAAARKNDHVAGKDVSAAAKGASPEAQSARAPTPQPVISPSTTPKPTIATNPIDRINGQQVTPGAPTTAKNAVSPDEINDAIESLGAAENSDAPDGAEPASHDQSEDQGEDQAVAETDVHQQAQPQTTPQPQPRRRGMSPQELMLARPSSPLVAKQEPTKKEKADPIAETAEEETGSGLITEENDLAVSLPPAPSPQGDLWDPATALDEEEAARLDRVAFEPVRGPDHVAPAIDAFLNEAREKLDSLRATMKTLRVETEKLDAQRREMREKISGRIEELQDKLDRARSERG
ncbi:MAG: AAA family ATPase [Parvularcula sp.]